MALDRKSKTLIQPTPHRERSKNDLTALILHMKENPLLYAAAALVVVLAGLAGLLYRVAGEAKDKDVATAYAKAIENEDPALRLSELEQVQAEGSTLAPEVQYMIGETAYKAGQTDKAKAAFERVRDQYPNSTFVPPALEGLGYIFEDQNKPEEALKQYQQILEKYKDSFAADRQPLNIGRVHEKVGKYDQAVKAYTDAITVFPGSHVASKAQQALDRLRAVHPELFKEEAAPAVGAAPAPLIPAIPTPTTSAPSPAATPVPPPSSPETPADAGKVNLTLPEPGAAPAAEASAAPAAPTEDAAAPETPAAQPPAPETAPAPSEKAVP